MIWLALILVVSADGERITVRLPVEDCEWAVFRVQEWKHDHKEFHVEHMKCGNEQ